MSLTASRSLCATPPFLRARTLAGRGGRAAGRIARLGTIVSVLAVGVACMGVSPAVARTIHVLSGTIGAAGSGAGQLSFPWDVAVNDATGNVYVTDVGNDRVDEFGPSGAFIAAWGDDVDQTTGGNICTAASGDTCQAGTSASTPGAFEFPGFVAVDNSGGPSEGDVYVGDFADSLVTKYTADGTLVSSWGTGGQLDGSTASNGPFGRVGGVAVDQGGNLWVYDNNSNMFEFTQGGGFVTEWNSAVGAGLEGGIAVDSADNLYVLPGQSVEQFSAAGRDLGSVSSADSIRGVAVDTTTNDVYAYSDSASLIRQYSGAALSSCVPAGNCAPVDTFGSGALSLGTGLVFNTANGTLYAADTRGSDIALFAAALVPDVSTGQTTAVTSTGATLNGTVNPDGTTLTDCHFEYVTAAGYDPTASDPYGAGQTAACTAPLPSGTSPQPVSADVTGLTPGTVYHFRLVAANSNGSSTDSPPADQTFATGPVIDRAFVSTVGTTSATVDAQVNPEGLDTTYHVEYGSTGPCSTNPCTSVPVPDADIGSQSTDQTVEQTLSGLTAGTKYFYRVVATNSVGTTDGRDRAFTTGQVPAASAQPCPNAQLRTGYSAYLPDCRAYEPVSPRGSHPYLESGLASDPVSGAQASSTGDGIGWFSYYPLAGSTSDGMFFLSTRGASGWSTQGMIPPQSQQSAELVECQPSVSYSADLSREVVQDGFDTGGGGACGQDDPPLVPGEQQGESNLFLHDTAGGSYPLLNPAPPGAGLGNAWFEDGTPDMAHVVFEDYAALTSNAPSGVDLYESSGGTVSLVSVLPDGTPVSGTLVNSVYATSGGEASFTGAVSADGSRVFFQANGNLYVRENATAPQSPVSGGQCTVPADACTVQADASQASGSGGGGAFAWASSDGSEVFFTDDASAALTADTVPGSGANLYEYDVQTAALSDLTAAAGAQVQAVSGVGQDGSYVYFVANGALANGATAGDCGVVSGSYVGSCNLYVYHAGATRLIATLPAADAKDWGFNSAGQSSGSFLTSVTSPSGRFLAFESVASLTGYDNADQSTGNPDSEVYLYDASSGALGCVSCDRSGASPVGPAALPVLELPVGSLGPNHERRAVLDDGRVFFDSPDALLLATGDGQSNVYESEPSGVGSCSQPSGCLALISSGSSTDGSFFYDASASGDDVFFTSSQDLAGVHTGGIASIYDARVNGGFPASAAPASPCADSQSCHGATGPPPAPPSTATVSFSGPGDQSTSAAAATGKVQVVRHAVRGDAFAMTVKVPAAGGIRISGASVTPVERGVAHGGSYSLLVRLTRGAAQKLSRKHQLSVELQVRFSPASGRASTVRVQMTVAARTANHRSAARTRRAMGYEPGGAA